MRALAKPILSLILCSAVLLSCRVGRLHTPDSALEQKFSRHRSEFDLLLAEVTADEQLKMIGIDKVRYGNTPTLSINDLLNRGTLGLTAEKIETYRRQLRAVGLVQVTKGVYGIEFRVDQVSILNGDSSKGYQYCYLRRPAHVKPTLDVYQLSESDRGAFRGYEVFKQLDGNWYLYLFINGS